MSSATTFAAPGPALMFEDLVSLLRLPEHQIRAALDPACAATALVEEEARRLEAVARLAALVSACALTGCPPCRRRVLLNN